jgi:two-component system, chemotaxis family, protein-glutamate methylesterase/glutaminase
MNNKIRTLVVDDSGFVVSLVTRKLEADPEIEVVGSARSGKEAIEKIRDLKPDVITLDVVMPDMNGLAVLEQVMLWQPTPVVMLSALTGDGTETTIRALAIGAVDFFLKPSVINPTGSDGTGETLTDKIKRAAKSHIKPFANVPRTPAANHDSENLAKPLSFITHKCPIVVIGSSTGGPRALMQVIPNLPKDFPAAILIVQHMPPVFTRSLAERLNGASQIEVKEACEGSLIKAGQALLAPGSHHMVAGKNYRITLNQDPPVLGVRPSIDITMKSVAEMGDASFAGVVLTGMGSDGTAGSSYLKAAGGRIIVEDESTCAVFGMPKSIIKAGYADKALPIQEIASELINTYCKN